MQKNAGVERPQIPTLPFSKWHLQFRFGVLPHIILHLEMESAQPTAQFVLNAAAHVSCHFFFPHHQVSYIISWIHPISDIHSYGKPMRMAQFGEMICTISLQHLLHSTKKGIVSCSSQILYGKLTRVIWLILRTTRVVATVDLLDALALGVHFPQRWKRPPGVGCDIL